MSIFRNPLPGLEGYGEIEKDAARGAGPLLVTGLSDSAKAHFIAELASADRPWKLVVTHDEAAARSICDDLRSFSGHVWLYPARDLLFYTADIRGFEVSRDRISVWRHMVEDPGGIVVTTVDEFLAAAEG